jgi:glyoxylase-like metal-dependent hydrolase (beta-lactamase superfamily II)
VTADRNSWAEPGVEQVAADVWRIPLELPGDGLKAVNVYAMRDGDGLTFVDGGWALDSARQTLVNALAQIGAGLGDIRRFLVTHLHRDHYSNALAIRREFGSRVLLGSGERPAIESVMNATVPIFWRHYERLERLGAPEVAQLLRDVANRNPGEREILELPDAWIAPAERFQVGDRVLEAIPTPGHTTGHVVFADHEAGVLFAGDHVLPHITPSVAFEPVQTPLALRNYLESLRLVRAMPDMLLLPAHGPAGQRVHARVDELLAHHANRLDEMAQVLQSGWCTPYEVAQQIGWTRRLRRLDEMDGFNQMLAVYETALHLDLLVAQGIAVTKESDGVVRYGLQSSIVD